MHAMHARARRRDDRVRRRGSLVQQVAPAVGWLARALGPIHMARAASTRRLRSLAHHCYTAHAPAAAVNTAPAGSSAAGIKVYISVDIEGVPTPTLNDSFCRLALWRNFLAETLFIQFLSKATTTKRS
jgi:hypothetical protein